jgi:hypothetical protein
MSPAGKKAASDSFHEIATVRIELRHTDPLIWREVEVPTSITLKVLHDIVQFVMNWFNYHLWEFTIGGRTYGLPFDDEGGLEADFDSRKVRLRDVLAGRKTVIDYVYDFGDDWEHRLTVTRVRPGEPGVSYPRYDKEISIPADDEISTQKAAGLLQVSRSYFSEPREERHPALAHGRLHYRIPVRAAIAYSGPRNKQPL